MHFHMGNIFSTLSTINVKIAMQFMFQAVVSCRTLNGAREEETQPFISF